MRIGFTCAYTPLSLIDAAGCAPYRILPTTEAADQAGRIIHDNMCPHVKRILDRAMGNDLPELGGVVLVNSCDAMRRLADGWRQVRPDDRVFMLDLPPSVNARSTEWFAAELERLREVLSHWTGRSINNDELMVSLQKHNQLADSLDQLRRRLKEGSLTGGSATLQEIYNDVSTRSLDESISLVDEYLNQRPNENQSAGVPIYLIGNVLPDPAVLSLIEECGAQVVADDLCTGSRLVQSVEGEISDDNPLLILANALLHRPMCARTFNPKKPGQLGLEVVERAKKVGAKGIIAHIVKFCDPYLGRMPALRAACWEASLPLLVLEGDCTSRSVGQQATRIEAFVEMLEVQP